MIIVLTFLLPHIAHAVLPPELVVSAGAQLAGIFSLLVAVFVSFATGLGVLYLAWYQWFKKWSVYIAFGVLLLLLIMSNVVFVWLLNSSSQPIVVPGDSQINEPGSSCESCKFFNDNITLYMPDESNPIAVEIDVNRKQESDGAYSHYYFLDGTINNKTLDQYGQFKATNPAVQPYAFLQQFTRVEPTDASVRAVYSGALETTSGIRVEFTTSPLQGDFVTRNTPEYTQFQSVTKAEMVIDGVENTAYALVETIHSTDYEKRIFFPTLSLLDSLTHQFVLWDETGNFYLIDDSQVFSETAAYPSHSWLLYKEASNGNTKKGFDTSITQPVENRWQITVPDFHNGVITVDSVKVYELASNNRSRYVVSGVVVDDTGERSISGLLRVVR